MSIDPLTEKYMDWGPYVFSGNRVIDARELEGLEPVPIKKDTKNLVIAVIGWQRANPASDKTQVKNSANVKLEGTSFAKTLETTYSSSENTQVAVFQASMNSSTPDDITKSIEDFRKISPDGKLVLGGHSMGADNLVNIVNDNKDIKVDKLITLDISDYGTNDNQIPSNVTEAVNFYQTSGSVGGTRVEATDGNTTSKVTNYNTTGTTHKTIDNLYRFNVLKEALKTIPVNK